MTETRPGTGHVVLADADSAAFASLRRRPTARAERYALGRACASASRAATWATGRRRPTGPIRSTLIKQSHEGRLDWLIPIRVGRMVASPYGFLRGTAVVMAEDVAQLPSTGITPVICGDAHLGNFGFYASPERDLVIDLNDFDEAHPGGWEWDLRRLVASIWVAGRQNGFRASSVRAPRCRPASRPTGRRCVGWPTSRCCRGRSSGWTSTGCTRRRREQVAARGDRAGGRAGPPPHQRPRAAPLHRASMDGRRRIVEEPPLITRVTDAEAERWPRRSTTT